MKKIFKNNITKNINDKTFFGFLFKNLEVLLLIGMFALIASIYFSFVEYVSKSATFIAGEKARFYFATRLIAGLLFVEVLLALATSYFRGKSEWFKSVLVTLVAFAIAYYNHLTIVELFNDFAKNMPHGANAVQSKMVLANWLIFGLGEVIGLLMHSKSYEAEKPPQWAEKILGRYEAFGRVDSTEQGENKAVQSQIIAQGKSIGFEVQKKPITQRSRGKAIDYKKMSELLSKGLKTKEIATILNCSEASIRRYKKEAEI